MEAFLWFIWYATVILVGAFCAMIVIGIVSWPIILIYRLMRWSMGKPNKPLNIGRPPSLSWRSTKPSNYDVVHHHHHHHHDSDDTVAIATVAATTAAAIIAAEIVEDGN